MRRYVKSWMLLAERGFLCSDAAIKRIFFSAEGYYS